MFFVALLTTAPIIVPMQTETWTKVTSAPRRWDGAASEIYKLVNPI